MRCVFNLFNAKAILTDRYVVNSIFGLSPAYFYLLNSSAALSFSSLNHLFEPRFVDLFLFLVACSIAPKKNSLSPMIQVFYESVAPVLITSFVIFIAILCFKVFIVKFSMFMMLGPFHAWAARLRLLPGDLCILEDAFSWTNLTYNHSC